ncbi:MAG: zinc ribbon domain-containing protein [Methanobacteriota archaeon]|nr:MAG: zinc ribbon domain-containing protein [Euryarchaeota archaeon]
MVLPVSELGCPTCGAILGPYELLCPSCGAKLKHLMKVENLPPRQRELHDIANGAIGQASAHLGNARRLGVKVDLADDLLAMAKKAAMQADFAVALDLASKSGEEAETQTVQFEALQNRVRGAKRAMAVAREDGADLTDSEELLEMANEAAIVGDYRSALRYALKAAQRAERGRERHQAWKVEISDWLK